VAQAIKAAPVSSLALECTHVCMYMVVAVMIY